MSFTLSKLTLGTAQLGQAYGVANTSGPPSVSEVCQMLETAASEGINCIDTAAAYGQSEAVLGQALREANLQEAFTVVTKVQPLPADLTASEAETRIRQSIQNSLRCLELDALPCVLLHREENLIYWDILQKMREQGLCELTGVSVASPEGLKQALDHSGVDAVQIPTNAVDHRFTETGLLQTCAERDILVFARSAFLQGLLLMDDDSTPSHLLAIKPARDALRRQARSHGIPLSEYLLRLMVENPLISSVVIGVETTDQVKQNTCTLHASSGGESRTNAALETIPQVPGWILNPAEWPNRKSPCATTATG